MGPAIAVKDHIRDLFIVTKPWDYCSIDVITDRVTYGIPKGVGFSLPCESDYFDYKVVDDFVLDEFTKNKIEKNYKEIVDDLALINFQLTYINFSYY